MNDLTGARRDSLADLRLRVGSLERERRQAFDDAQREADALFAQYQLSQLLASGGTVAELGTAVLHELLRLARAAGAALYLQPPDDDALVRIADAGTPPTGTGQGTIVSRLDDVEAGRSWIAGIPGGRVIPLSEGDPTMLLAVWPGAGTALDDDGLRVALLARHELGVAFAGARLRETLEQERHELGAIVDGATDLILQVDADDRVVRLNPAGERQLGLSAGDAIGRTCGDVLGCEAAGGHRVQDCPLTEVRVTGVPIAYRETAVRGASGAPVRVAGSYAATHTMAGPGARATAILRDISAVKALEELREGFVATVSHELRTPLALIRGYAESLLYLDLEADQQRHYVERIDDATGRLAALVDQVLDVTHLQADPLILERTVTTFPSLIARLRGELDVAGGTDRLVVELPGDLPALNVDVGRVGQVLSNLVGNARKYAPDGPVVISAAVDGDWLAVTVDDEGIGVPEAERGLVTEPFHRAWNVRESRIPGTGLGLFICRRLVEAHGGRLEILDRPDGRPGTRVRITLPLVEGIREAAGG
ncbi:MAG TPA: PAS domain-containing sensor histidine kinase [Candidatus Limnocylindrales bacterium]|nr:PAS domain-containing sensor histidine kinase [Candidatus Limnocylindrales bacterium]